jgi:OmpA-OmpF porin, OOP family
MTRVRQAFVTLSAAIGLAVPSIGMAQGMAADTGWYVGGSIGQSEIGACDGIGGPGVSCDDKDTSWRILGGYQVNKHFALELGYQQIGEANASGPGGSIKLEATVMEFVAVGMLPVADRFSVYGKIGLYRGETDASGNTFLTGPISESESNTDLTFGVGLQFDVARNFGVRAEWQRYQDIGGGNIGEGDVDVMSIGLIYRFR